MPCRRTIIAERHQVRHRVGGSYFAARQRGYRFLPPLRYRFSTLSSSSVCNASSLCPPLSFKERKNCPTRSKDLAGSTSNTIPFASKVSQFQLKRYSIHPLSLSLHIPLSQLSWLPGGVPPGAWKGSSNNNKNTSREAFGFNSISVSYIFDQRPV